MGKVKDLTGQRFGLLTAIELSGKAKNGNMLWKCYCDCGNTTVVFSTSLVQGTTKSCGCYKKLRTSEVKHRHGGTGTRLYRIWTGMLSRCKTNRPKFVATYVSRNITVCDEWKDYQAFHDWAISNGYRDDLTIDRIDVNGNYEPNNCRWVTQKVQQNNRSNNHLITFNGKTQTMSQWADELGMRAMALQHRIMRGWTVEQALTIPIGGRR